MNTRLCIALSALALFSLTGCGGNPDNPTAHKVKDAQTTVGVVKSGVEWSQAQQQFLAGELDKALNSINKSLSINPDVPKSHVLKGRIIFEKGDLVAAKECFARAEELDANNVDAQYYQGLVCERMRQPEQAQAFYARAMEIDPANPQYVVACAEMLMELKRLDDAENLLIQRSPTLAHSAGIRQTLGQISMLKGNPAKAVEYFSEARLMTTNDSVITEDLAGAMMASGQYADAEYHLQQLIRKEGNAKRRDLIAMRAKCLVEMDRLVEARTLLIQLTSTDAGARDLNAWVQLGQVAAQLKDVYRMRFVAGRVIALAPNRWEGYALRGMFLQQTGDQAGALVAFNQAAQLAGDNPAPLVARAVLLSDMGRTDEARSSANQALSKDPTNKQAAQLIAYLDSKMPVANVPESSN